MIDKNIIIFEILRSVEIFYITINSYNDIVCSLDLIMEFVYEIIFVNVQNLKLINTQFIDVKSE